MRVWIFAALLAASPATALEREFDVKPFDRIVHAGSGLVTVRLGTAPRVVAVGSRAALAALQVNVESGVLRIADRPGLRSATRAQVFVQLPELRAVTAAGGGSVEVARVRGRAFDATVEARGAIDVRDVAAERVRLRVAGPGRLSAGGSCDAALLIAEGAGALDAGRLRCRRLSGSVSASGDLAGFARDRAVLALSGSGDARVAGGAQCRIIRSGSGVGSCEG